MPNRFSPESTGIEAPTGARTEGCFIGCMLTSRLLLEGNPEKSTARIIDACKMAADHGAQIVGLGAKDVERFFVDLKFFSRRLRYMLFSRHQIIE